MRRISFATLLIVAATLASAAQGSQFGAMAGAAIPAGSSSYNDFAYYATTGWDAALTFQPGAPAKAVALRYDIAYTFMNGNSFTIYPPGPGAITSSTDFASVGGSANVVWNVVGAAAPAKVYLIGGLGWYAVQTIQNSTNASFPHGTTTVGAFGYNAGFGVRYSRFFVESRYTTIVNGTDLGVNGRSNLVMFPVNVGILF